MQESRSPQNSVNRSSLWRSMGIWPGGVLKRNLEKASLQAAEELCFCVEQQSFQRCGNSLDSYQGMPSGIPQIAADASGFSR